MIFNNHYRRLPTMTMEGWAWKRVRGSDKSHFREDRLSFEINPGIQMLTWNYLCPRSPILWLVVQNPHKRKWHVQLLTSLGVKRADNVNAEDRSTTPPRRAQWFRWLRLAWFADIQPHTPPRKTERFTWLKFTRFDFPAKVYGSKGRNWLLDHFDSFVNNTSN